ncbi:hypothetical protein GCM10010347_32590 [Streptomyces cirratus]|uniref:Lipoprotein n=1 Tax=Streptomyces cirratus TaxID=68187 RepID=A0ABQ3F0Y5_9ACTN|nr:hypothetical protein [Streptomyces cirratus]GHB60047.1 hypothetical protein GCM10010347_32590 [Streptomyces cirratus]
MGAIRSSATALLSAGATGVVLALGPAATSAAVAAGAQPVTSFAFAITPSTVAPGGQVVLSVSGCNSAFATSSSGVFDTVSIARGQTARVTVDRDARPGALYSVTFTCNGQTGSADLTIAGGTSRPTTSSTVGPPRRLPSPPTAPAAPTSSGATLGVRGGLGGSVAGLDLLELGVGAGLVLAAVAGTGYVLRRRSSRGH